MIIFGLANEPCSGHSLEARSATSRSHRGRCSFNVERRRPGVPAIACGPCCPGVVHGGVAGSPGLADGLLRSLPGPITYSSNQRAFDTHSAPRRCSKRRRPSLCKQGIRVRVPLAPLFSLVRGHFLADGRWLDLQVQQQAQPGVDRSHTNLRWPVAHFFRPLTARPSTRHRADDGHGDRPRPSLASATEGGGSLPVADCTSLRALANPNSPPSRREPRPPPPGSADDDRSVRHGGGNATT
jgi:hypothetical protein